MLPVFYFTISMVRRRNSKNKRLTSASNESNGESHENGPTRMRQLFGFDWSDLSSWESFLALLHRPTDPASLAITRVAFGFLMLPHILRKMTFIDDDWGDYNCRFPLFDFIPIPPLQGIILMNFFMIIGSIGIMLGLFYRTSAFLFVTCFWYKYVLDIQSWNNHFYLYGLISTILLFADGNRFWSLDGFINKNIRNAHTPLWNIALLRFQIFVVYFYAGLKKTNYYWLMGYSKKRLSEKLVFAPFRALLTNEQIDLHIVHHGGFILDLAIGFFLFFDVTRPFAMFFGVLFHLMNSTMFRIGLFPWLMIATLPLFCYCDWPKALARGLERRLPWLRFVLPSDGEVQSSSHCIYPKEEIKPDNLPNRKRDTKSPGVTKRSKTGWYHRVVCAGVLLHVTLQLFLPYSHFINKGYNFNWIHGIYGYSWDMMIKPFVTANVKITMLNKENGQESFIPEKMFTKGRRWPSHPDLVKQLAMCIKSRAANDLGLTNVGLYFDIWRKQTDQFYQRIFDPRVDITKAEWHPFKNTPWVLPLLTEITDWRSKLADVKSKVRTTTKYDHVPFVVADFPGLSLKDHYLPPEFGNASVTVLHGRIVVELENRTKLRLRVGETLQLPSGKHTAHTTSKTPSCYMYVFGNQMHVDFVKKLRETERKLKSQNKTYEDLSDNDPDEFRYKQALIEKKKEEEEQEVPISLKLWNSVTHISRRFCVCAKRSSQLIWLSVRYIFAWDSFKDGLKKFQREDEETNYANYASVLGDQE